MRSALRSALTWARAQRVPGAGLGALLLTGAALLLGDLVLAVPGVPDEVPALRLLPAALAACGALVLEESWAEYEAVGRAEPVVLRAGRFGCGLAVVLTGGAVVVGSAGSNDVLALALLGYAALATLVGIVGRFWWTGVVAATYLQLHVRDLEQLEIPVQLVLFALVVAASIYLVRGDRMLGRSRSPTAGGVPLPEPDLEWPDRKDVT